MARTRALSPIAHIVVLQLDAAPAHWSHGYDLGRRCGIRSGTLYPLLIRLERQGLLLAEWQDPTEPGRPPRHAYRLTESGRQLARDLRAADRADADAALNAQPV